MTFDDLDLLPTLRETLTARGFTTPTPVQRLALPRLLARQDVVAVAQTGSGKTLTYVLPILDQLKRLEDQGNPTVLPAEPRGLVVVPTRELCEQVAGVFKDFTHATRLRVRAAFGGQPLRKSRDRVAGTFDVLIATPGRLEKLVEVGALSLEALRIVILDEADHLLEPSFVRGVLALVQQAPGRRQLALFSATLEEPVRGLVADLFPEATLVETDGAAQVPGTLTTRYVDVPDGKRFDRLPALLAEPADGGTLLFANTRDQCDRVCEAVRAAGHACEVLRGESDPVARRRHLRAFRAGELPMLVATDMAARGLDIPLVGRVINVHLPRTEEAYLHRAGRTARAGRPGVVVNLVTPRDAALVEALGDGHVAPRFDGRR